MDYLSALRRSNPENTPLHTTAKTAETSFDSKGSGPERLVSVNRDASADYRLDYTARDLTEFDSLLHRYCDITAQPTERREKLLAARLRMRPASVAGKLREFRRLVAEVQSRAPVGPGATPAR
jgi:hypothetical protein